jgi:hypothetical protein
MATMTETTMRDAVRAAVTSAMAKFTTAGTRGNVHVKVATVGGQAVATVTAKVTATFAGFVANEERDVRWAIRSACERGGLATDSDGASVTVWQPAAAAAA